MGVLWLLVVLVVGLWSLVVAVHWSWGMLVATRHRSWWSLVATGEEGGDLGKRGRNIRELLALGSKLLALHDLEGC